MSRITRSGTLGTLSEREWKKSEGDCAGTATSRKPEGHDRRLHAGCRASEARGPKQFGQASEKRLRFGSQVQLSGSNWIMKKNVGFPEFLFCWRPRRDLNPCYRRERAMS